MNYKEFVEHCAHFYCNYDWAMDWRGDDYNFPVNAVCRIVKTGEILAVWIMDEGIIWDK